MDMNAYLSMFIDESNDHLQSLNENLLKLEGDPEDISIVQVIFRSAHTLKGMSATMGYEDLASLTHEMENVLDLVRNSKLKMDSFIFDTLFKGLDALESMVQDIIAGGTGKADVTPIVAALKAIVKGEYQKDQPSGSAAQSSPSGAGDSSAMLDEFQSSILLQSIESGLSVFHVVVTIREDCVLKAARAYMVFDFLERNGEVVKSSPSVQDIEQEKFERSFTVFTIANISGDELQKGIESVSEIESAAVTALDRDTLMQIGGAVLQTAASMQSTVQAPAPA
ncbi:Hpt domain-containing protein, partial [Paenibacillus sepulcri]|nr:Hpt domain-containing protein [Paenibacillus sepulcri]